MLYIDDIAIINRLITIFIRRVFYIYFHVVNIISFRFGSNEFFFLFSFKKSKNRKWENRKLTQ